MASLRGQQVEAEGLNAFSRGELAALGVPRHHLVDGVTDPQILTQSSQERSRPHRARRVHVGGFAIAWGNAFASLAD
ncbi:MAG: hypothetical protein ACP5QO_15045 [Clostridia bacterium]